MIENKASGIFIVDEIDSPLWKVASTHALRSGDRVLAANQYLSPAALIRDAFEQTTSYLIFSWRGAFDSVLESGSAWRELTKHEIPIFLLIPDLLGIHQISKHEQNRINTADGILVTSQELFLKYSEIYTTKNIQILHDIPPLDSASFFSKDSISRNPRKLIWIGNSKWGERAGFVDHKGLYTYALPAFEKLKNVYTDLSITVIDSASEKLTYDRVLSELASSACLLFTSNSEGTGLPLIESAALGTPLVTFDVGIASELLQGDLEKLISAKNLDEFCAKVTYVIDNNEKLSRMILEASKDYLTIISEDIGRLELRDLKSGTWRSQKPKWNLLNFLKWKYRWIRYLKRNLVAS
jgi:glycosyltransferase involved in cell wall biosynthesis